MFLMFLISGFISAQLGITVSSMVALRGQMDRYLTPANRKTLQKRTKQNGSLSGNMIMWRTSCGSDRNQNTRVHQCCQGLHDEGIMCCNRMIHIICSCSPFDLLELPYSSLHRQGPRTERARVSHRWVVCDTAPW